MKLPPRLIPLMGPLPQLATIPTRREPQLPVGVLAQIPARGPQWPNPPTQRRR